MAAISWARSVQCDYPGCHSVGEVKLQESWPDRELPAGWLGLSDTHVVMQDAFGMRLNEFCSIHAYHSISQLAAALKPQPEKRTDGDGD